MTAIADAAIAETAAGIAWEQTRGQPYPVQLAAFEQLRKAYQRRVELCRQWIRDHPVSADDGPELFEEGEG